MADIEKLSKQIEQGHSKHDEKAVHHALSEMHSWKAHGSSQHQIDVALKDLSHKLHKDGVLPGISIIGFDKKHDTLIVSDKKTHTVALLDANLHKIEKHDKPLEKHDRPLSAEEHRELSKLERTRGVTVEMKGDQFTYHLKANGKDEVVLTTEASMSGLRQADTALQKQIQDKESQLKNLYHVRFANEGDAAVPHDPKHEELGYIKARLPRLDELAGVEAALKHSAPAQLVDNDKYGRGVKFYFLNETMVSGAAATYKHDMNNVPAIFMEPGSNSRYPTEIGAKGHQVRRTIEAVLTHELAHNSQHKTGWDDAQTKPMLAAKIGWVKAENSDEYYFNDKQGRLFKNLGKSTVGQPDFVQCNTKGEPVDEKGNVVDQSKAKHLRGGDEKDCGPDTMIGNALVKPVTHYFPNPVEMFADGMQAFRLDEARRANLLRESPSLYYACKEEDQKEIDAAYGWGHKGMVRDPNGELKPDSPQEQRKILAFENGVVLKN